MKNKKTATTGGDIICGDDQSLASLIERGGVYYDVPGSNPKDMLAGLIGLLPPLPGLDPEKLLAEILEREALVSTGVGRGIALPHPRNPMLTPGGEDPLPVTATPAQPKAQLPSAVSLPLVALAFPAGPIDWNTPDGSKVHTVFLLVSISAKQHLNAMSKINFLCQQEKFYSLIRARASKEIIIAAIREAETAWAKKP